MGKTLFFFLALSLFVVLAQSKHGYKHGYKHGGRNNNDNDWDDDGSGSFDDDDDDDDDDDWDDVGSGLSFNGKKPSVFPGKHRVTHQFRYWNNNGQTVIHLKNCFISNCMKCRGYNCWKCMPGFRLKRKPFLYGKRCVPDCPFGKRDANGRCQNNVCQNVPNCLKCQTLPWNRSCMKCRRGWFRYKAPRQAITRCVSVCPRGYRATNGTTNSGPSCEKIPSFCFNAPNCQKCDKFPWTRSCLRCNNGWYRYKPQYHMIATCLKVCPRGYRANAGTQRFGPTCEKIPSFCFNAPNCVKCDRFPWTRSCLRCRNGWYRYKPQFQLIARCLKVCPRGFRPNAGTQRFGPTCEKIPSFCFNAPNCVKCDKFPWTRSCLRCRNGWYRYKPQFQKIARCLKVCPRGFRPNAGTQRFGPTCEKIPSFCFNTPRCLKCDKFPWTRSCLRCEDGWYRYKAPYQKVARCLMTCPRGYRANTGGRNVGPTCEKIPSFCHQVARCSECEGPQWRRSCKRCDDGWYRYKGRYGSIARCVRVCPRGYQLINGKRNYGPTCKRIPSFCHQLRHCDECPGFPWPRSCRKCEKGWYRYKPPYHKTTRCIRTCPRGYRAINGTRKFGPTCKKIPSFCLRIRKCKECPDAFPLPRSCQRCEDGWYRYIPSFQLDAKCIRKCPRGYQVTNGTSDTGPTCEEIQSFCRDIPHCQDCQGPFWPPSCDRCEKGWYRYENPPSQISATCVQDCPVGFQATNGTGLLGPTCEKSQSKCPFMPGCEDCPKINACSRCKGNMSVFDGLLESKCVYKCPMGFDLAIKNAVSVCQAQDGCLGKLCVTCKKGWYKLPHEGRMCHRECPSTYFEYLGSCMKCKPGCKKCKNIFKCEECDSGMARLTSRLGFGERCVLDCPRGYTKELVNNTSYECRKVCRDKNCENCESVSYHGPYHCDYCKPGFHKLHRNLRDKCVINCPSGYTPEMDVIEGSVCRKDRGVESTSNPIPAMTTDDGVESTSNPTEMTTDVVSTTSLSGTQPPP